MTPNQTDDPDREGCRHPSLRRSLFWSGLAFLAAMGLFTLIWARYINPLYFPYGDSFSLFANSLPPFHPAYSDWFLHGFRSYFDVYPDMSLHATDFLRPVVNGTFFLGWFVYGTHWSRYLLTTYAIIGLLAATVCFLASYVLELDWPMTLLATLCVIFAPSIGSGAIFDPAFAFDLLGGLFVLLAVTALISDKLLLAWTLLLLAVFTKETALFAAPLTALIVLLRKDGRRRPLQIAKSAAFLLPVAAWMALRWYDFHGEKGVYVFMDSSSHGAIHVAIVRFILGLTDWPIASAVFWPKLSTSLRSLEKTGLILNIVFWIVLAVIAANYVFENRGHLSKLVAPLRTHTRTYPVAIISVFCAASLVMLLVLDIPRRFGGVFFPLFILCLVSAAHYTRRGLIRIVSLGMVAAVGVTGAVLMLADFHYHIADERSGWAMARDYTSQLSRSKDSEIFSIDDLSGRYASTEYIQKFTGFKGRLIRVNDIHWDFACAADMHNTITSSSPDEATITSLVPTRCGGYSFDSVFPPMDPKRKSFTRSLASVTMHYTLAHRTGDVDDPKADEAELRVELYPYPAHSSVLIADPATHLYQRIPLPWPLIPPQPPSSPVRAGRENSASRQ